jgi:GntR family transcriptional regulator, transcriptional repressor for pyruvate dehydrogenase complex
LSNYFYFKNLKIQDIYELRKQLEPEIVTSLCGRLSDGDLNRLKETMTIYSSPAATQAEEYQQRIDELAFHEVLADLCPNPLLSFFSQFLLELLKNLNSCHDIYNLPNQELFETGRYYQMALYDALKNSDVNKARTLIHEHMISAERIMTLREREIKGQLL